MRAVAATGPSVRNVTITGPLGIGKARFFASACAALEASGARVERAKGVATVDERTHLRTAFLPLGLPAEVEVRLGPLPVPTTASHAAKALARIPSVALLLEAARLDLEAVDERARAALARLAAASDGHPAVLEQIAGWLAVLSPIDAARASSDGTLDVMPASLESAVEAAASTQTKPAATLLAALAELRSPFDLTVARVAAPEPCREHLPSLLTSLVASGLLLREGDGVEVRWRVPLPFARRVRDPVDRRARHALTAYFAGLAMPLLTAETFVTAPELRAAGAEIRFAWEDARARQDDAEVALAVGLSVVAWNGDPDVRALAERIRATLAGHPESPHRGRLAVALGETLLVAGDAADADAAFSRAADAVATTGERSAVEAIARIRRAALGPELGQLEMAWAELEKGASLAEATAEALLVDMAMNTRGLLLRASGDVRGALAVFAREAERARRLVNPMALARAEAGAADCHLMLGETSLARTRYECALRAVERMYPGWARTFEGYIGLAAWEGSDLSDAVMHFRRALGGGLSPRYEILFTAARAGALAELGDVARASRDLARAEAALEDASSASSANAVHAASLLVERARANDEASRRATEQRIQAWLDARLTTVGDEERAFARALARVAGVPATSSSTSSAADVPEPALRGRPRLEKLFATLRQADGKPVRATTLFDATWPDEPAPTSRQAEARVRKAISVLRDLGLRGAIVTTPQGYALRRGR